MKQKTVYRKQPCHWNGCKIIVQVDTSFDIPALGARVAKFCDFHDKVYHVRMEIIKKIDPSKHYSTISNDLYKNNRKEHTRITNEAIRIAKGEASGNY